jgi:hypothetical protein
MAYDLDAPVIPMSVAANVIKNVHGRNLSKRMMSHVVTTTIRETSVPADGRGSKRILSFKDLVLVLKGLQLADLGLSSDRVLVCVDAIRTSWDEVFPPSAVEALVWTIQGAGLGKIVKLFDDLQPGKYLTAGFDHKTKIFLAEIMDSEDMDPVGWAGRPTIISELSRDLPSILLRVLIRLGKMKTPGARTEVPRELPRSRP